MRKLRRLPWRLPKQTAAATAPTGPHRVERNEVIERPVLTQPVAYTGGRYVYGSAPSVEQSSDSPRGRHRTANIR